MYSVGTRDINFVQPGRTNLTEQVLCSCRRVLHKHWENEIL